MQTEIALATTDEQIQRCFPVMAQLRPHLVEAEFLGRIRRQQRLGAYELVYLEANGAVKSVAGFRISECLYYGKFLYVDDLATEQSARSKGYGGKLLDWLFQHAKENDCAVLALDSGVQRFDAHRFYLSKRLNITCHHFDLKLK